MRDAGFDELGVEVALLSGDAGGRAFIERRRGAWMQSGESSFKCTRAITPVLAEMAVSPTGYGDKGAVLL